MSGNFGKIISPFGQRAGFDPEQKHNTASNPMQRVQKRIRGFSVHRSNDSKPATGKNAISAHQTN
nr:hypothetical protein [Desulfobacula toluolica]